MKRSLFAAVLLCAAVAVAQPPNPPNPPTAAQRAAHEAERMDKLAILLDLNDGQKAQVQTVLQAEHAKAMQLFQQQRAAGTRPTREQMKAIHDQRTAETTQQLSTVLTASQLKKFQILEQQEHGPRGGPHGPPPGAPPSDQN